MWAQMTGLLKGFEMEFRTRLINFHIQTSTSTSRYLAPGKAPIGFGWEIRFPDVVKASPQSCD